MPDRFDFMSIPLESGIPKDRVLFLRVEGKPTKPLEIHLTQADGYVMGRSDNRNAYVPDIDFADYLAQEKGVSRRHAALVWYQDRLHLLDLASVNGTFINGRKLEPDTPYPLNEGDEIALADLNMQVTIL
jgi:pSer/pThr/pTyr-binding forkhead associated (FHA) protein